MPSLLSVPAEIRSRIYQFVLGDDMRNMSFDTGLLFIENSRPALELLLTCKQISNESREIYHAETLLSCQSIKGLKQQLSQIPKEDSPVRHIRVAETELDTAPIPGRNANILKEGLTGLSNLETLAFSHDVSRLYEDIQPGEIQDFIAEAEDIGATISQNSPKIKTFGWITIATNLEFLVGLPDLRLLHFTGYSQTTPSRLLEILRTLRSLKSVIIEDSSPAQSLFRSSKSIFGVEEYYASITPEVIKGLKGLKTLQFRSEYNAGFNSTFITPEIVDSVCHLKDSLTSFRLRCCACERSLDVLAASLKALDECKLLREVDVSIGFEVSISMGAPDPQWLEKLKKETRFDTMRYDMYVEKIPSHPPRAVGIRICSKKADSLGIQGLDWGYSRAQQKTDMSGRWISHQVRR
jgi:hypothetical protein